MIIAQISDPHITLAADERVTQIQHAVAHLLHPMSCSSLADELASLVSRHPQIERVLAGHVYSVMLRRFAGTLAITCASITSQMFPNFQLPKRLAIVLKPPSCLLHVWRAGSELVTHTNLIGDFGPYKEVHDETRWL